MVPLRSLGHAGATPEPFGFSGSVLQTLLDLDSLVRSDQLAHDDSVSDRRVEGLVSSSLIVKDIFADDSPVSRREDFMTENLIGMPEPIKDESMFVSTIQCEVPIAVEGSYLLVCESFRVCHKSRYS